MPPADSIALLITTLVALTLCQANAAETANAKTHKWGPQSGPFQLSIVSNKDEYRTGEDVRVTAVLKNVTDDPAWVQMTYPVMFYHMDIRLPFPAWINFQPRAALTAYGQRMKNPRMASIGGGPLAPGREIVYDFDLSKLYDMSATGVYHIAFSCKLPLKDITDPRVVVTSNEITIAINPK